MTNQQTGSKDEFVFGAERLTGGLHLVEHDARQQAAPFPISPMSPVQVLVSVFGYLRSHARFA